MGLNGPPEENPHGGLWHWNSRVVTSRNTASRMDSPTSSRRPSANTRRRIEAGRDNHIGAFVMPYELRAKGSPVQTFDTEEEAVAGAREILLTQPDSELEIW